MVEGNVSKIYMYIYTNIYTYKVYEGNLSDLPLLKPVLQTNGMEVVTAFAK